MATNFGRADPPVMRQKSVLNSKCESSVTCGLFSFFYAKNGSFQVINQTCVTNCVLIKLLLSLMLSGPPHKRNISPVGEIIYSRTRRLPQVRFKDVRYNHLTDMLHRHTCPCCRPIKFSCSQTSLAPKLTSSSSASCTAPIPACRRCKMMLAVCFKYAYDEPDGFKQTASKKLTKSASAAACITCRSKSPSEGCTCKSKIDMF